jgi:hypothetical protein
MVAAVAVRERARASTNPRLLKVAFQYLTRMGHKRVTPLGGDQIPHMSQVSNRALLQLMIRLVLVFVMMRAVLRIERRQ